MPSDTVTRPHGYNAPRRDTPEQRAELVTLLIQRLKAFDCRFTRLLGNLNADFGITRARLRILDCIIESPGSNISQIAYDLDLSRQSVHRTVHAMHAAGLLELQQGDGRSLIPVLAATGRVVAKIRLTQAYEWSLGIAWGVDTKSAGAAVKLLGQLLRRLPKRMISDEIDPDHLPTGIPPDVAWALAMEADGRRIVHPQHPIMRNGGDRLWPNRQSRRRDD